MVTHGRSCPWLPCHTLSQNPELPPYIMAGLHDEFTIQHTNAAGWHYASDSTTPYMPMYLRAYYSRLQLSSVRKWLCSLSCRQPSKPAPVYHCLFQAFGCDVFVCQPLKPIAVTMRLSASGSVAVPILLSTLNWQVSCWVIKYAIEAYNECLLLFARHAFICACVRHYMRRRARQDTHTLVVIAALWLNGSLDQTSE